MTDAATTTTRVVIIGAGAVALGFGRSCWSARASTTTSSSKRPRDSGARGGSTPIREPSATCPRILYSYSFTLNPEWSKTFAGQAEILRYLEDTAESAGLQLGTAVESIAWSDDRAHWLVTTANDQRSMGAGRGRARSACSTPRLPRPPGLGSFGRWSMHSARWDHKVAIEGRTVAVTGRARVRFRSCRQSPDPWSASTCSNGRRHGSCRGVTARSPPIRSDNSPRIRWKKRVDIARAPGSTKATRSSRSMTDGSRCSRKVTTLHLENIVGPGATRPAPA